ELLDGRGQEAEANGGQRRHVKVARLCLADGGRRLPYLVDRYERALDLIEQELRLGGRRPPAGAVDEQGGSGLPLEPPDETADGGLGHAKKHCSAAHGASQHGGAECFQLLDEHECRFGFGRVKPKSIAQLRRLRQSHHPLTRSGGTLCYERPWRSLTGRPS